MVRYSHANLNLESCISVLLVYIVVVRTDEGDGLCRPAR